MSTLPLISRPYGMRLRMLMQATSLAAALALTGCASVGSPAQSSLGADSLLQVQPDGTRAWRAASLRIQAFHVQADALDFAPDLKLDAEQRLALARTFNTALVRELQAAGLHQASGPGAGVVSVRARVTDVTLASPGLNALTTVLLLAPLSRGGVTLDVDARAFAVAAVGEGAPVAALSFKGQAGVNNVSTAFSSMGHVNLQVELAARKFAELLVPRSAPAAI